MESGKDDCPRSPKSYLYPNNTAIRWDGVECLFDGIFAGKDSGAGQDAAVGKMAICLYPNSFFSARKAFSRLYC